MQQYTLIAQVICGMSANLQLVMPTKTKPCDSVSGNDHTVETVCLIKILRYTSLQQDQSPR